MPEDSPAQTQAGKPNETKETPEKYDTSTATAEVRIRYTADTHPWATPEAYWPAPYLTHYGASSVRLLPQYSDPKFIGENLTFLDNWAKDAQTRDLTEPTIKGYHRNLRAYAGYLGPLSILPIGVPQLTSYMDHLKATRGIQGKQLAPHVSALASLYDYLASEQIIPSNPVPGFRRRFLAVPLREAHKKRIARRQLLSVDHMRLLVRSMSDHQHRTILVVLVKTGVRCGELVAIDVADIDWKNQSITLKPFRKRTNTLVFFDKETEHLLKTWLLIRNAGRADGNGPLFLSETGRMTKGKVGQVISRAARRLGMHNPQGDLKARFTPHACRHWFTTFLLRAGMEDAHVQFLRGDSPGRSMDPYYHIDWETVRHEYLKAIPQLGLDQAAPPQIWSAIEARIEASAKQPAPDAPVVLKLPELGPPEPKPQTPRATPAPPMPVPVEAVDEATSIPEPEPAIEAGSGFQPQRRGSTPSTGTLLVRKAMRQDKAAKTRRPRAEYLSLLGAGRSRTAHAADLILNREAKRVFGKPLGRDTPAPRRTGRRPKVPIAQAAPVGHEPVAPAARGTAASRPPRAGRQAAPVVVKLREAMQADAAAKLPRSRTEYLEILASGGPRSAHAADQILNREAKRIFGRPLGRDTPTPRTASGSPTTPAARPNPGRPKPVATNAKETAAPRSPRAGRQAAPSVVKMREAMQADAAAKRPRSRADYLEILASGGPRSAHAADQILNREAKRMFGHPIGRANQASNSRRKSARGRPTVALKVKAAPVAMAVKVTGRPPNPTTLALRQRIATDSAAGRVREPGVYVKWVQAKTKVSLGGARQLVAKQLVRVTNATPEAPLEVSTTRRRRA